jgi:hypothetical protein
MLIYQFFRPDRPSLLLFGSFLSVISGDDFSVFTDTNSTTMVGNTLQAGPARIPVPWSMMPLSHFISAPVRKKRFLSMTEKEGTIPPLYFVLSIMCPCCFGILIVLTY